MRISVVLSFFNEAENIPELLIRLRKVFAELKSSKTVDSYELIFVNDASTDGSLALLAKEAEKRDVKVISMSRNFGVSPCVMAGMQYASGDYLVYMDTDLQDPPELIPKMLGKALESNADIIHTVRTRRDGENPIKMLLTRFGYWLLKKVSQIHIEPNSGDFKLISRRALSQILTFREKKPFVRGIVTWVGFKQEKVFYERDARFSGDTKFPIYSRRVISNFLDSALISFSDVPLKIVSIAGIFVSMFSFALLVHVLIEKALGNNIPGWTAMMVTITFIGGMQMISLGIVGLYINAIFLESKVRPNFIVESTLGFENLENHSGSKSIAAP